MKMILIFLAISLWGVADILPFQTIQKANDAYRNGAYERSASLFAQLDTNRSIQAYNIANAYYKAKRYKQAIVAYQEAVGVDESVRLYNLGNCYFQQQQWDQAISYYEASLKLSDDEDAKHNLALAKRKKEQEQKRKKEKKRDQKKEKKLSQKRKESQKKGQEKAPSKQKKPNNQQAQRAQKKEQSSLTPQERMTQKELKRLIRELKRKKMPTMIYQVTPPTGVRHDQNPW